MAAYIVIDRLAITDPEVFGAYQGMASVAVMSCKGRYALPHGLQIEALQGNWQPQGLVVIEFDDAKQARQWWNSAEYAEARGIHHQATISNVILLDGAPCGSVASVAEPVHRKRDARGEIGPNA